ncbi:hypothetical protein FACS1894211_05190 [Clostridia bacterium]|nr:hypothetical protein FACS1894211_05190 [Clostridia bacterium]
MREKKSLSYLKLAKELGVSPSMVFDWEKGITEPTATNLRELALFFNVTTDYLLGLTD